MKYEVRDAVCDYGVYENGELKLILNSRRIALELEHIRKGDEQLINSLNKCYELAKSEAIKEFAERLKSKLQWDTEFENMLVFETDINNLVREMTEGEK